jgi:hypothetical protein
MKIRSAIRFSVVVAALGVAACSTGGNKSAQSAPPVSPEPTVGTFDRDTVIREATGVFGKGAEGVGKVIEKIFADLGRPNAYIVGQEAGGAFIGGLRYGDGIMYHKIEGQQKVHWTGPSVGFDVGGDASKSFTLIYNLNDAQEIFRRYPAVEGKVYFIGGFSVNYHQRGNVILAPVHLGAGWRLGVNIGYLNYTKERTFIPF